MKKILLSLLSVGVVAVVAVFATNAYFSDEEKSVGNTFQAGALDLKVDNSCYYNKLADGNPNCPTRPNDPQTTEDDESTLSSWEQTDLGPRHKFFWFTDVKPGDFGEDTISLHVDNDAWLRLLVTPTSNLDNTCTEPESGVDPDGNTCGVVGELQQKLVFSLWLDQGGTPGFQGKVTDPTECDNLQAVAGGEPTIITEGSIDPQGETWNLSDYQGTYLKGGETTCFGVAWSLPGTVGNEVQTDSFVADMTFQVVQHRNNPTPTF